MEDGREQRIAKIFRSALDLPENERDAFVELASRGDREVLERVKDLLDEDARGTSPLLAGGARPAEEERWIGPYKLVRVLGEGGMGTVYLAHQEKPFARDVALKTVRVGGGSADFAGRIENERKTLAFLDHPAIARVLDAGISASGLPYFVMEYVPGRTLTDYCDRHWHTLAQRIRLFQAVCAGVQHAHQKGIVHRDLKPSNVLVAERDGRPVPKIIDFGIARAVAGPLALEGQPRTGPLPIGTLVYMSPEQADPMAEIDTCTDIYALGVTLYELLAGVLPFDLAALDALGPLEGPRALFERDPPLCSARFLELGAEKNEIAQRRRTSPSALARALRGDLDWIVAKALARERSQRYASASGLADDLERHLRHAPVSAGPPSHLRLLVKFVRRNRFGVAAGALFLAALGLGLIVAGLGWKRAREEHALAELEIAEARYQAEKGSAFVEFTEYALALGMPGRDGADLDVLQVYEHASPEIAALFPGRPAAEAAVRFTLGRAFLLLGQDQLALRELEDAHRIRTALLPPDHVDRFATLSALIQATRRLKRTEAEQRYVREALDLAERIVALRNPGLAQDVMLLRQVAEGQASDEVDELEALDRILAAFGAQETRDEAEILGPLVVEAALVSSAGGEYFVRLEAKARALLGTQDVRYLTLLWKFARYLADSPDADPDQALSYARDLEERATKALGPAHWMAVDARRLEGLALARRWKRARDPADLERAERLLASAVESAGPPSTSSSLRLAEARRARAPLCALLGETDLAPWIAGAWDLWRRTPLEERAAPAFWPAAAPDLPVEARTLTLELLREETEDADVLRQRAFALCRLGRFAESEAALDRARELGGEDATSLLFRALALAGRGRMPEARAAYREALARLEDEPVRSSELRAQFEETARTVGS